MDETIQEKIDPLATLSIAAKGYETLGIQRKGDDNIAFRELPFF